VFDGFQVDTAGMLASMMLSSPPIPIRAMKMSTLTSIVSTAVAPGETPPRISNGFFGSTKAFSPSLPHVEPLTARSMATGMKRIAKRTWTWRNVISLNVCPRTNPDSKSYFSRYASVGHGAPVAFPAAPARPSTRRSSAWSTCMSVNSSRLERSLRRPFLFW